MRLVTLWGRVGVGVVLSAICGCEGSLFEFSTALHGASSTYCGAVEDWDPDWEAFEEDVFEAINVQRGRVTDCHSEGVFPAVPPLELNEELRCAARNQSVDMAVRNFFDHKNPDGLLPWDRMAEAGYDYYAAGENIGAGYPSPREIVDAWVASDGHCANLMSASYVETGVGFFLDDDSTYTFYWTQTFASPAPEDAE